MSAAQSQVEKLRRILEVTRQMAATTDLDALLAMIIEAARDVLDCERATIFLYDSERNELYSRVATGVESIRFAADRGIAGTAAQERVVVNVPDAYADPRFNQDIDKRTGYRTRTLLTFPLENLTGELMGVLQTLNKRTGPFDAGDEELARVLSAQAGVALHRWRLLEEYAEKQRMARDLEIARSIQQALFPRESPQVPGYDLAGWNRCADETGGDCYDFIPLPDGRLAVLVADATGHGIGAALVIAQFRSLARATFSVTQDVSMVADRVNRLLADDIQGNCFVTALIAALDPQRHRLDYVSAGQGPLLFLSNGKQEARCASGVPLAIIDDMHYEAQHFDFAPGDALVLLTDGFYETLGPGKEQFGEERVTDFVTARARTPLPDLITELHEAVRDFSAGGPQADDLTAVLIRRSLPS
ncbi:MAG: SpoIIE family protein phosphatase [Phycisphaerae bacterium]|jgi:phosphoserine phosphatase